MRTKSVVMKTSTSLKKQINKKYSNEEVRAYKFSSLAKLPSSGGSDPVKLLDPKALHNIYQKIQLFSDQQFM